MRLRPLSLAILIGAVVFAVPFYALMLNRGSIDGPKRTLDPETLQRLADSIPGPKPVSVKPLIAARHREMAGLLATGAGLHPAPLLDVAYVVSGPWGTVLIDGGYPVHDQLETTDEVSARLNDARLLLFTGEEDQLTTAVDDLPPLRLAQAALLNPAQAVAVRQRLAADRAILSNYFPFRITSDEMTAVAPGVVVIRTPGHTSGAQMIYVNTQDGRRLLLTGNTAPLVRSWSDVAPRAWLQSTWLNPEPRGQTRAWLAAVEELHRRDPLVAIVPGSETWFFARWSCTSMLRDPGSYPAPGCANAPDPNDELAD